MSLIAFPSDDMTTDLAMTNEDALYPAFNAINDDPVEGGVSNPARSTTTSTVFTLTTSTGVPDALFLINHNWDGATVTIDGIPVPIPLRTRDGQCTNAWIDLRATAITGAASHTLAVTGTVGNAQIGRIFLSDSLRTLDVLWEVKMREQWLDNAIATIGGKRQIYNRGFRNRAIEGPIVTAETFAILRLLAEDAQGRNLPWPIVPWDDRNDALWVTFIENALVWEEDALAVTKATVAVEQWLGLPLPPSLSLDFPT